MVNSSEPLLTLRGWSLDRQTAAGSTPVLRDVDLDLYPGRWLAVVGANGSGKSSLLKFLAADESPVAERAAIMFQDPDEQIFATGVDREITLGRVGRDPAVVRAEFGLDGLGEVNPRLLSAGQKQRLVLAVTLGAEPDLLLCDEPTSLQDETQARWVLDRLDQWRQQTGGSLVTATCDRREAERADELLVLAEGRVVAQGPTAELLTNPLVAELLGSPVPAEPWGEPQREGRGTPVLTLTGIGCDFSHGPGIHGLDLTVRPGERWGLIGVNGCGKSTLLALAAGARRPDQGQVLLLERKLYGQPGLDLDHGLALLAPQFPEYLFSRATVAAEIALDPALAKDPMAEFLGRLSLPANLAARNPHDLSSGQKRRLALGLVLGSGRPLVLLDEPTAALDRAGKELVLDLLAKLPAQTALLIASHDREFLNAAGCCVRKVTSSGLVTI